VWKVNSTGHPISKSNPIKSRVTEDVFLKCGKQEKGVTKSATPVIHIITIIVYRVKIILLILIKVVVSPSTFIL